MDLDTVKKWQSILKKPFVNLKETGVNVGYIGYAKSGGTKENPIVFIENPSPLNGEEWDDRYLVSHRHFWKKNYLQVEGMEVSSYGRVRKNGIILMPKKTSHGLKTEVKGYKLKPSDSHKYEDGFSAWMDSLERTGERGRAKVRYSVSLKMLKNLNETIPQDAKLFVDGKYIGTYNQLKYTYW